MAKKSTEASETRHNCSVCGKKRIESQMYRLSIDQVVLLQVKMQGRAKWKCKDCTAENRRYGLRAPEARIR